MAGRRSSRFAPSSWPPLRFLELCDLVVELAQPYGATVIVNDRADLARLSGAAGVHVGQEDLAPGDARAVVGESSLVGCSTHTIPQVDQAAREPVDYIAVGPIFGTRTKATGYERWGSTSWRPRHVARKGGRLSPSAASRWKRRPRSSPRAPRGWPSSAICWPTGTRRAEWPPICAGYNRSPAAVFGLQSCESTDA